MTADGDRDGGDVQPRDEREDRPELDFESAFEDLRRRYDTQVDGSAVPWPAAEDLDPRQDASPTAPTGHGQGSDGGRGRHRGVRAMSAGDDLDDERPTEAAVPSETGPPPARTVLPVEAVYGTDEPTAPFAAQEGYTPPEPPPLPRGDVISRLAWAGVIGGPLFLLLAALVWRDLPAGLLLAALGAFVGGFVTLVARMPGEAPEDGDDGAVV